MTVRAGDSSSGPHFGFPADPGIASAAMRRTLPSGRIAAATAVVLCAALVLVASGCGVAADDSAAVVGGTSITTSTIDELAADTQYTGALQIAGVPTPSGVIGGPAARQVLAFEIQRTALLHEVDRLGLKVSDADTSQALEQLQGQFAQMRKAHLERLAEYLAARQVLEQRLGKLDATSAADRRFVYDGIPGQWDQVCVTIVAVKDTSANARAVRRAIDRGTSIGGLVKAVKGAQQVIDPKTGCVPAGSIPSDLRVEIERAPLHRARGPVSLGGVGTAYAFEVQSRRHTAFGQAGDQLDAVMSALTQAAQQQAAAQIWTALVLQQGVWVNPRYGSGVVSGSSGLDVLPPSVPLFTPVATGAQQTSP